LKPENVLVFANGDHHYAAKIADFGYSCFDRIGNGRVYPPKSEPWCAPDWHHRGFSITIAKRRDIFSLGMLYLWVLLEHVLSQVSSDENIKDSSTPFQNSTSAIGGLAEWKKRRCLPELADHILRRLGAVIEQDASSLRVFFRKVFQNQGSGPELSIQHLVQDLSGSG
jgi:serine/threonine protein kinase